MAIAVKILSLGGAEPEVWGYGYFCRLLQDVWKKDLCYNS